MKSRKIVKIVSLSLLGATIMSSAPISSKAAWKENSIGCWYTEGSSWVTGWREINETWYFFDKNGYMKTGWVLDCGTWYYLESSGAMATGWKYVDRAWYYFKSSGAMASNEFVDFKGDKYYFETNGTMVTGFKKIGDNSYYFYESGAMAHDVNIGDFDIDSNGWCHVSNACIDTQTMEECITEFSIESAKNVLGSEDKTKNSVYSPTSVYMALSLLSEGAKDSTKEDIYKALNYSEYSDISSDVNRVRKKLTMDTEKSKCIIGNSLWLNSGIAEFNNNAIEDIRKEYGAEIFTEKFDEKETAESISKWIKEKTNGKVGNDSKDFKISQDSAMEIINTLYFKDNWSESIDKSNTKQDDFTLSDKSKAKTDFMHDTQSAYGYECSDFKASSLYFKGGNKMVFVLPSEDKSPYDILNNKDKLKKALTVLNPIQAEYMDVSFTIPKFKFSSKINLNESLKAMGLEKIYLDSADFSNFTENPIKVGDVKQEAFIGIDEEGAEAAAYTEIAMQLTSCAPEELKKMELKLDRPFIYAIMSEDNIPLFIGVINNPNLQN